MSSFHVLDLGEIGGGEGHGQQAVGLVTGGGAAAGPALRLLKINAQRLDDRQRGLVLSRAVDSAEHPG